jgi:CelD/BcsL family acetyltransferase involved in cellulose biosynthesis
VIDPWGDLPDHSPHGEVTHVIRPGELSSAHYLESRRAEHPKRFKNFRRLERQVLQDHPALRLEWGPVSAPIKEQLFAFKSAQYRESGLVDLIQASRSRRILDAVAASPMGFQTSLWSGDTFVSAHFGVRDGAAFHPWIAAYAPAFAHYSPGNLLLKKIIEHLPDMGLTDYDLAEGHDHYKKYYANTGRVIYPANVIVPGLRGALPRFQASIWNAVGARNPESAASRLNRRLDHAAISEERWLMRAQDLFTALRRRREPRGHAVAATRESAKLHSEEPS